MTRTNAPTPYPEINHTLHLLLDRVKGVLQQEFVGMYLYGSLASGDFNTNNSDIDFVVITAKELMPEIFPRLERMHRDIGASGTTWAKKLEGAYVPQDDIRRHNPLGSPVPCINEGEFYLGRLASDWVIQRHILREHGIVVAGPPLAEMIDPVSPDSLRDAVRGILHEWWAGALKEPSRIRSKEYQAYAVLTMCRALYALKFGEIVSKPLAAKWAREAFSAQWGTLIEAALAWWLEEGQELDCLGEVLDLIGFTIAQFN